MKAQIFIATVSLFFFSSLAPAEIVADADKAAAELCAEAKTISLKAPSSKCAELKPSYVAASTNLSKVLAACVAVPRILKSLDEKNKSSIAKCDISGEQKNIEKAAAESAKGKPMTSPEVMAGQTAKNNIHRCADITKETRDGAGGSSQSYVKTRNDMISLRDENSKRYLAANKDSMTTIWTCVPEGHPYPKANERLHFIASGLYQMAAARIEASEKEERTIREAAAHTKQLPLKN